MRRSLVAGSVYALLVGLFAAMLAAMPAFAQGAYSVLPTNVSPVQPAARSVQGTPVTLIVHDSTVIYVVRELTRQAHVHLLVYDDESPLFAKRVSMRAVNANVMDALAMALKGTGLTAELAPDGRTVVIHIKTQEGEERQKHVEGGTVTGMVVDSATGKPIAGVNITVRGIKLATVTAANGRFVLKNVPTGTQTIVVKVVGYEPAERSVEVTDGGTKFERIVLGARATILSGVVTTATGQAERRSVGNDITVINVDSVQAIAPISTVTDLLATRVPGLIVQPSSGVPGAPSRLRLRGESSLVTSDDPIVIVDGVRVYATQSNSGMGAFVGASTLTGRSDYNRSFTVQGGSYIPDPTNTQVPMYVGPSPLDQIDPNSIETIEVIKGPSASALYGSDAANGVIIITTKKGHPGQTHWNLSLTSGMEMPPSGGWPLHYFPFGQNLLSNIGSRVCSSPYASISCVVDSVVAFQALNDQQFSPFQTGRDYGASLSVSGGDQALTYSLTGTATRATGYLRLPDIEEQRFRTSHGFSPPGWMRQPNQYATYGATSRMDLSIGSGGSSVSLNNMLFYSAQQQSSLNSALQTLQGTYIDLTALGDNALVEEYYNRGLLHSLRSTNALSATLLPRSRMPIQATLGLDLYNTDNSGVTPRDYILGSSDSLGMYAVGKQAALQPSFHLGTTLGFSRVMTAVGVDGRMSSQSAFQVSGNGLPIGVLLPNTFTTIDAQGESAPATASQSTVKSSTFGWYVAPRLNFRSRFFVSPGIRFDGGSSSGSHAGLSGFPKIDLSWVAIDRKDEAPMFGALTLLRPRLAFGIAGVQPGPLEAERLLEGEIFGVVGGSAVDGLGVISIGNTQLRPERSREVEGGVDVDLWQERVTLTLTGYEKMRYDAIMTFPLAPSMGYANLSMAKNIGTIRNTGVNATISATPVDRRGMTWAVNMGLQSNTNTVVSLAPGLNGLELRDYAQLREGYPLNAFFARSIASFFDQDADGIIEPGEYRLTDSVVYLGSRDPKYQLDVNTTLAFFNGRLSVNTALSYQSGVTQKNISLAPTGFQNSSGIVSAVYDPRTTPFQQAAIAAASQVSGATFSPAGFIQTVNLLRWSTFSINYIVPQRVAGAVRAGQMQVSLQGSNLGLHTNYRGVDPGMNSDTGQLPTPRKWELRISLRR